MNDPQTSIEEEDIHAYVDGTLSDERRLQVEQALERNPELAARVSDYFSGPRNVSSLTEREIEVNYARPNFYFSVRKTFN